MSIRPKQQQILCCIFFVGFAINALTNGAAAQLASSSDSGADDVLTESTSVQSSTNIPELNRKTLNFAIQHLGQQVGSGECSALVAAALKSAGARLARGFVFGRELGSNEPWLPGDIIQFTDCLFVESNGNQWQVGTPHHTSIIRSTRGRRVTLLQQNSNHNPRTQEQCLDFDTKVRGSYKVYRPLPEAQPGAIEKDFAQNVSSVPVGNLYEILQQPIVPGPMFQARQEVLDMIRSLQAKRVNTYFYRQKFQDIEMRIAASTSSSSMPIPSDLTEAIETLRRELATKSTP